METVNLSSEEVANILTVKSDYEKNMTWLLAHFDELAKYHKDQYVAVCDDKAVAFADTIEALIDEMADQPYDIRSAAIRQLSHATMLFL